MILWTKVAPTKNSSKPFEPATICCGLLGSTATEVSLCGNFALSQLILMFPPHQGQMLSVHVAFAIAPIPGESRRKSAVASKTPDRGGPLYCRAACWA
jgi:hypothetical protein